MTESESGRKSPARGPAAQLGRDAQTHRALLVGHLLPGDTAHRFGGGPPLLGLCRPTSQGVARG